MFALTDGTAPRSIQPTPFLEGKPAFFTISRLYDEAFRMGGPGDMLKMIQNFSFFDPEQFRNLECIKTFRFQSFGNFLPQGEHALLLP